MNDDNNLTENEKNVIEKIHNIYKSLRTKDKNINTIIKNINDLVIEDDENEYLKCLLYPEEYKGVKIPSDVPLPSCTFNFHETVTIKTNEVLGFVFNPIFLYNFERLDNKVYSSYGKIYDITDIEGNNEIYNKSFTLDYLTSFCRLRCVNGEPYFDKASITPHRINQKLPEIYNSYRLVSACAIVKYIGKVETANGIIGGTILNDESNYLSGKTLSRYIQYPMFILDNEIQKYSDYKLLKNNIYHKENNCLDGMKLIYYPLDNSYTEFIDVLKPEDIISSEIRHDGNINYYDGLYTDYMAIKANKNFKNGFKFYVYFLDDPKTPNIYKIDLYCNYECLPNPKYIDYLSLNIYNNNLNIKSKQNIINYIQNNCIVKLNDLNNLLDWEEILKQLNKKNIKINNI